MLKPEFFNPVSDPGIAFQRDTVHDSLASAVRIYTFESGFPDLLGAQIAIIGVNEFRGSAFNREFRKGTDAIREKLYRLKKHEGNAVIVDLGDLKPGNTVEDTYYALTEIVTALLRKAVIPFIIGGSQDIAVAQFNAYKNFEQIINLVGLDARFDLGLPEESLNSHTWLGKIVLQQPNYLFNFSNIGYQTYFVGAASVDLMNKLYFDAYRVGMVRSDITEIEPVIRSADMLTVDLSVIRQSDAPGSANPSPNGMAGEEACQAMMYAGLNDRLTAAGIFEYDLNADLNQQTAHLVAQMIWYFIEGFTNRKNDIPMLNHNGFITYTVILDANGSELVFLKHKTTGRWWMEMPVQGKSNRFSRHNFLPCSYKDYQQACQNEMPDRYWQAFQKLS